MEYGQLINTKSANIIKPLEMNKPYAYSVSGGAGGRGIKISTAYGTQVGSGFRRGYDYHGMSSGSPVITNEKATMQHLNNRLGSYLETVRSLEKANSSLEIKIRETIEKRGHLDGKDFSKYNATITELRAKISDVITSNTYLSISMDNARLASDDFRMRSEFEMSMRQTVEADVARLRKILDDTNVIRLNLESDIESLKEELIILTKNHEMEVEELHSQITKVGVHVDVDAPKGQDLAKIMEEMRAKYEKIALNNQEELKKWHDSQVTEMQVQVTESSTALKEANTMLSDTKRKCQALDIEKQAELSMQASLKGTMHDIEMRHNTEMEKYNVILLRLQEELTRIRTDIQHSTQDYESLLDIKVKLEEEIAEYRRLLGGEADFTLQQVVDSKTMQTRVLMVTQTLVNGVVVSESKDVKTSEIVSL
uniref:Keratin 18a, tandem duplicate 2 n=1 Tax=Gasterosteus aculeatus aculeatus TaxID=481459 RepID=A0AAQ4PNE4_GASAC